MFRYVSVISSVICAASNLSAQKQTAAAAVKHERELTSTQRNRIILELVYTRNCHTWRDVLHDDGVLAVEGEMRDFSVGI